ncbi:MAG TPA: hypothetical protein VHL08_03780 [Dongiaceae bacterium]|nr:hypothetical protein [Dongiaceae bacterium]
MAAKWTGQNIHIRTLEDRIEAAAWEADILLDNICATNATDVAGIIAKLSVAIECNRLSPDNEDQPWRCVVSALRDLRRISADDTDYLSGKRAA